MTRDSWTLIFIRVLRFLPHTARFDRHLTDCAALEIFYDKPITFRHILLLDPLPARPYAE